MAAGPEPPTYTNATISAGDTIRAVEINELRAAVRTVQSSK